LYLEVPLVQRLYTDPTIDKVGLPTWWAAPRASAWKRMPSSNRVENAPSRSVNTAWANKEYVAGVRAGCGGPQRTPPPPTAYRNAKRIDADGLGRRLPVCCSCSTRQSSGERLRRPPAYTPERTLVVASLRIKSLSTFDQSKCALPERSTFTLVTSLDTKMETQFGTAFAFRAHRM